MSTILNLKNRNKNIISEKKPHTFGILFCVLGSYKSVSRKVPENLSNFEYVDKIEFLDLQNGSSDPRRVAFKTLPPEILSMSVGRQPYSLLGIKSLKANSYHFPISA